MAKQLTILGSTGSIGCQTLEVVSAYPEEFVVEGLAAGQNTEKLIEQALHYRPKMVCVADEEAAARVAGRIPEEIKILHGMSGMTQMVTEGNSSFVMSALVGSRGLKPTLAAIEAGKTIGLANKETLVSGGHLVTAAVKRHGVDLLPVDSEHSAIFQALNGERLQAVKKLIITASGGSFRDRTREQLRGVTVEEALAHPNWSMGAKITIDSATMINKGLEVIEAHWLFNLPYEQIEVIMHPQSVIHSMVEYHDHSVIAQLGAPDMRVPIQYAMTYPERRANNYEALDLIKYGSLTFREMDMVRFPCLKMAYEAGKAGGTMPTVLNAANEIAVARFLQGEISFLDIEHVIEEAMQAHELVSGPDLAEIEAADQWARQVAASVKPLE